MTGQPWQVKIAAKVIVLFGLVVLIVGVLTAILVVPVPMAVSVNDSAVGIDSRQSELLSVQPASTDVAAPNHPPSPERLIVIVIDDVGYSPALLQYFLKIPVAVTFSVLPGLPGSRALAAQIRQAGRELLLHQPMEPNSGKKTDPGLVTADMPSQAMVKQYATNLAELPGLVGANNHMGSKGTRQDAVLLPLFEELNRRGLFFLDSKTGAQTRVKAVAKIVGLPVLERDIFWDTNRDPQAIRQALYAGLKIADQNGYAIMIGHVWSKDLAVVLTEELANIRRQGYTFTTLQKLLASIQASPSL